MTKITTYKDLKSLCDLDSLRGIYIEEVGKDDTDGKIFFRIPTVFRVLWDELYREYTDREDSKVYYTSEFLFMFLDSYLNAEKKIKYFGKKDYNRLLWTHLTIRLPVEHKIAYGEYALSHGLRKRYNGGWTANYSNFFITFFLTFIGKRLDYTEIYEIEKDLGFRGEDGIVKVMADSQYKFSNRQVQKFRRQNRMRQITKKNLKKTE